MARDLSAFIEALERRGSWTCRGCGMKILGRRDPADLCSEACRLRLARPSRAQILRQACVPPAYHTFDPRPWPTDSKSGLRLDAWRGAPPSVLIAGNTGTGKSTMAAELLVRMVRLASIEGQDALWVRLTQLEDERRAAGWRGPRPLWRRALSCRVLVVDDLGVGGAARDLMMELVEARSSNLLITIYTTWCPLSRSGGPGSIEELALPVYDRLEGGACFWLGGASWRGRQ